MHPLLSDMVLTLVVVALIFWKPELGSRPLIAAARALRRLARHPVRAVVLVALLAAVGSAVVAFFCGLPVPWYHDEFSYLLTADTFAHGRLSNPPHPMWRHFESFHVFHQPTYASKYPPGQGLVLGLGQLLGAHPAVGLWLSAGLLCAAILWMLRGWLPAPLAVLGAILVALRLGIGHYWTQSYWGGAVAAIGGALLYGALRRVVDRLRWHDAVTMGIGIATLANSRPYEGLILCVPAAAALAVWLLGKNRPPPGRVLRSFFLPIMAVLGLAAGAMAIYNFKVTGEALTMPYLVYERSYARMPLFVWQEMRPKPDYPTHDFERFYENRTSPYRSDAYWIGAREAWRRVGRTLTAYLGFSLLVAGVVTLRELLRDRWMRLALAACAVAVSAHFITYDWSQHYNAPITGLLFALALAGVRQLWVWRWRGHRIGRRLVGGLVLIQIFLLFWQLPEYNSTPHHLRRPAMREQLEHTAGKHLVIVRYGLYHVPEWDWVYNGADIDGAKVIWARDLGAEKNRELIDYFADRRAWLAEIDVADPDRPRLLPYSLASPQSGNLTDTPTPTYQSSAPSDSPSPPATSS